MVATMSNVPWMKMPHGGDLLRIALQLKTLLKTERIKEVQ